MMGKTLLPSVVFCLCSSLALLAMDGRAAEAKPADSQSAPANLTAAQIVERHVVARGGLKAWRAVDTLSLSGKMDAGRGDSVARSMRAARSGKASTHKVAAEAAAAGNEANSQVQLPFVLQMKRPNKSRVEIEFAGKTAVQVYDGEHGWKVRPFLNRNGVEPFTAEEAKSEVGNGQFEGPLVDYAARRTKVALEKVELVEGHDAYKLKLTLKDGRVQHVWIDAQSFLDVKLEGTPRRMDGRMHDVWISQRDFRKVDGLMIPFVLETGVQGYPDTHQVLIEKVSVNPKLDDARFAKPGA